MVLACVDDLIGGAQTKQRKYLALVPPTATLIGTNNKTYEATPDLEDWAGVAKTQQLCVRSHPPDQSWDIERSTTCNSKGVFGPGQVTLEATSY